MKTKKCTKCSKRKPLEKFPWQNKLQGKKHSQCKDCQKERSRVHFEDNKDSYRKRIKEYNQKRLEECHRNVLAYYKDHPCVDCGETHPATLQFDHRGDKVIEVSKLIASYTWEAVAKEIAKCDVRCGNCHAKKTAREQGWFTHLET